jgi:hypothetical protein
MNPLISPGPDRQGDGYYSVDGYPLFDGLRAAIGEHE